MFMHNLNTCIGAYRLGDTGIQGTRLENLLGDTRYDMTTKGFNGTETGTPTLVTHNGFSMLNMLNDCYFAGWLPRALRHSVILVGAVDNTAAASTGRIINFLHDTDEAGEYVPDLSSLTLANRMNNTYGKRYVSFYANRIRTHISAGAVAEPTNPSAGDTFVYTGGWADRSDGIFASLDGEAVSENTYPSSGATHYGATQEHGFTIGDLGTSTTFAAGKYFYGAAVYLFSGDVMEHPDYANLMEAEKSYWGV